MKISNQIVLWDEANKDHFIEISDIKSVRMEMKTDVHQAGGIPFSGKLRETYLVDLANGETKRFPKASHNDDAIINFLLMHCHITVKKY